MPAKAESTPKPGRKARKPRTAVSTPLRIDSEPGSGAAAFDDDRKWKLFITTNSKICAWNHEGCEPIFTSSSKGIVAAKRAQDGSMLAIADAQVVMLHQIEDGQDKSYRLRGTQRCRLLQYSHDSRNLFYTDSLHNNVQSYSLSEKRVAAAAQSHPSPVTSFAISCDSNLILSASADPSTIMIHNRMLATTITLVPAASTAPVVVCAFHPTRKHIFLLAFGDGVLAAYDYNKLSSGRKTGKEAGELNVTTCHARALHAFRHLHDPSIAGSAGITGAGFVPGQKTRAVTVGEDGRCFLVDFEKGDTVGSWHIGAPGTGLTIREVNTTARSSKNEPGGYLVAVGTIHGKCIIHDGNGNRIAERVIDSEGESVLDVEWVYGDINLPEGDVISLSDPVSTPNTPRRSESSNVRRLRSGKMYESPRVLHEHDPNPARSPGDTEPPAALKRRNHKGLLHSLYEPLLEEIPDQAYMQLFSPVQKKRTSKPASLPERKANKPTLSSDPKSRAVAEAVDHRSAISAPLLWEEKNEDDQSKANSGETRAGGHGGFRAFQADSLKETIPRDENVKSNNASAFKEVSSVPGAQVKVQDTAEDGRILSEIRSIRAKFSGAAKVALFQPSRVKSTPASKAVKSTHEASGAKRSLSVPMKKSSPVEVSDAAVERENDLQRPMSTPHDDGTGSLERNSGQSVPLESSPPTPPAATTEPPELELPAQETPVDDEDIGDIWLAQTNSLRTSRIRKRKRAQANTGDTSMFDVTTLSSTEADMSRASTTRSNKSRKTVSWSNEPSMAIDALSSSIPPVESVMKLSSTDYGDIFAPIPRISSAPAPHITAQSITTTESKQTSGGSTGVDDNQSLPEVIKSAMGKIHTLVETLQDDMHRRFEQQSQELHGLRLEVEGLRGENEKLRSMLERM